MQTEQIVSLGKEITNKTNNLIDLTLRELSEFYKGILESKLKILNEQEKLLDTLKDIIDEREGSEEMDKRGIALDNLYCSVEGDRLKLESYSEMLDDVLRILDNSLFQNNFKN